MVASKNDQTGETDFKPVVQLFNFQDKVIINLVFESRQGDEELIQATPEHPFMLQNGQWKSAGQLMPGDKVQTAKNTVVRLKSIATDAQRQEVYNFEVADFHTYFVGENGVWVHNTDCGDVIESSVKPKELFGRQTKHEFSGSEIKRIKKKMQKDGYDQSQPIDVVEVNGRKIIVDGHHRSRAAGSAGLAEVPIRIHKVDATTGAKYEQQAAEAAESFGLTDRW